MNEEVKELNNDQKEKKRSANKQNKLTIIIIGCTIAGSISL